MLRRQGSLQMIPFTLGLVLRPILMHKLIEWLCCLKPGELARDFREASVSGNNRNRVNAVGVQFTVIPEPGTWALALVGSLMALSGSRRKN